MFKIVFAAVVLALGAAYSAWGVSESITSTVVYKNYAGQCTGVTLADGTDVACESFDFSAAHLTVAK